MLQNLELPDEHSKKMVSVYVYYHTLETFQQLNKHLNRLGLCISISSLRLVPESSQDDESRKMKKIKIKAFYGTHYHAGCMVCDFAAGIRDVRKAVKKHVLETGHECWIDSGTTTIWLMSRKTPDAGDLAICAACGEPKKYHVGGAERGLCKNTPSA